MKSFSIAKSRRVRSSPYTSRIEKQGVTSYTVYNHMLLPAAFGSLEESCKHLKKNVQIWDVAAERQVEIKGKDASAAIECPTLLIFGALDKMVPSENGKKFANLIKNSETQIINECGHMIMFEKAFEMREKVAEFLKK